jgi:hypothetical protein
MEENFGEMTSKKPGPKERNSSAAMHGWRAGQTIEIRQPLNTSGEPAAGIGPGRYLLDQ